LAFSVFFFFVPNSRFRPSGLGQDSESSDGKEGFSEVRFFFTPKGPVTSTRGVFSPTLFSHTSFFPKFILECALSNRRLTVFLSRELVSTGNFFVRTFFLRRQLPIVKGRSASHFSCFFISNVPRSTPSQPNKAPFRPRLPALQKCGLAVLRSISPFLVVVCEFPLCYRSDVPFGDTP